MPGNNNRKEYIDIPINAEETPLHLFEKLPTHALPSEEIDIGLELLAKIDGAIRSNDPANEMLSLHFGYFQEGNNGKFAEKDWPAVHEIESTNPTIQANTKTKILAPRSKPSTTNSDSETDSKEPVLPTSPTSWTQPIRPGKTTRASSSGKAKKLFSRHLSPGYRVIDSGYH
jgi:hypothetical protein